MVARPLVGWHSDPDWDELPAAPMPRDSTLDLFALAPGPGPEAALGRSLAARLADILNRDADLPPEFRPRPGAPPETAESVLSVAERWSEQRDARVFAIVLEGEAIGSISLSHIDRKRGRARTGYFIAASHQGRGYGTAALRRLLELAREEGISAVSASLPAGPSASRRIWAKCGAPVHFSGNQVKATLAIPVAPP